MKIVNLQDLFKLKAKAGSIFVDDENGNVFTLLHVPTKSIVKLRTPSFGCDKAWRIEIETVEYGGFELWYDFYPPHECQIWSPKEKT